MYEFSDYEFRRTHFCSEKTRLLTVKFRTFENDDILVFVFVCTDPGLETAIKVLRIFLGERDTQRTKILRVFIRYVLSKASKEFMAWKFKGFFCLNSLPSTSSKGARSFGACFV